MTLGELATSIHWPFGLILSEQEEQAQAVNAARQYAAWGDIASLGDSPVLATLDADTVIDEGEWAIIKPLAALFIERENARALEASRGVGVDVYGRDVNTIEADIRQYESVDLPRLAFMQLPESI